MKKILYLLPFFFLFFFIATPSFAQDNCSVTPDKTTITASTPTTVNLTVVNNTAYPSDIHMSISQFILTNSYGQTPYAIGTASPLTWIREANGLAIDANYRGDTWVPYSYGDYISSNGGYETLPYLFNLPPGTFHFDTYTPTHSVLLDCGGIDLTAIGVGINPIPNAQIRGGDTFSASDSYTDNEPNATSWTATVDYGNGSGSQPLPLSGTNFSLSHVYTDTGRYTVTVTVTDDQGATATQTTQVFVNIPTTINTVALSPGVTRIYYTFYNTLNINPDLYPNINLTYLRIDYNANIVTPIDSSISIASLDHTCNCGPDYTNDLIVNNLNVAPNDTLTFWVDWQGVSAGTSHIRYQLLSDNVDAYLPGLDIGYTVVANTPPSVGTISVSPNPVHVNTQTFASATFTDPDTSDTHTAVWDWGDGNTSQGTITEPNGSTPGTVTGTHTYTSANVYTVKLTVTDNHNGAGDSTYKYVSVYNPTSQGLFSAGHLF